MEEMKTSSLSVDKPKQKRAKEIGYYFIIEKIINTKRSCDKRIDLLLQ